MSRQRLNIGFIISLCIGVILSAIGLFTNIGKIGSSVNGFVIGFFVLQSMYFTIFFFALLLIIKSLIEICNKNITLTNFEKIGLFLLTIPFIGIFLGLFNILPQMINTILIWIVPEIFAILLLIIGIISYNKSTSKLPLSFVLFAILFFFWIPAIMYLGTLYLGV